MGGYLDRGMGWSLGWGSLVGTQQPWRRNEPRCKSLRVGGQLDKTWDGVRAWKGQEP